MSETEIGIETEIEIGIDTGMLSGIIGADRTPGLMKKGDIDVLIVIMTMNPREGMRNIIIGQGVVVLSEETRRNGSRRRQSTRSDWLSETTP